MDLFWSLPDARVLSSLAAPINDAFGAAQRRKYDAGATVSDPDVTPHRAFRCISGTLKATKLLASGREILITILRAESIWSDRAMLNGYWKGVYIEAIAPAEIALIDAAAFEEIVRSSTPLLAEFMLLISEQVADALTLLDDFRGRDIAPRLARILVRFSKQYGVPTERGVRIELPVTHQDLANMIGTARETVSRNMARFRERGYVKEGHASTLEILSLEALEKLIV